MNKNSPKRSRVAGKPWSVNKNGLICVPMYVNELAVSFGKQANGSYQHWC